MTSDEIITLLPYSDPFLFVNEITELEEHSIAGTYKFSKDSFFYRGHFKDHPVTPGVILTECMAQIGLVSLGIYKLRSRDLSKLQVAFTSVEMEFLKPVLPDEKVVVRATETYFRFNKLKCKVSLFDSDNEVCAKGNLAGMFS